MKTLKADNKTIARPKGFLQAPKISTKKSFPKHFDELNCQFPAFEIVDEFSKKFEKAIQICTFHFQTKALSDV